jgi:glycylpeptide N-tetradecanoyltransferase
LDLVKDFEWYEIDVNDEKEMTEIFELLRDNYVEDDESMFRFAYPKEFLIWALTPPGNTLK